VTLTELFRDVEGGPSAGVARTARRSLSNLLRFIILQISTRLRMRRSEPGGGFSFHGLSSARGEDHGAARPSNYSDEIAPPPCLPQTEGHDMFGRQFRRSNQEFWTRERVQCRFAPHQRQYAIASSALRQV
jgi:hypothetical protein